MNKKRIWFVLPATILPYLVLLTMVAIYILSSVPDSGEFMQNLVFAILAGLLIFGIIAGILCVICFVRALRKQWDAVSLAKTAMILKLIQVPSYITIFILSILLLITIFTFPFSVFFFLLDCYTLFLTGILAVAAGINALRQGITIRGNCIWFIILQFVFCADVFATIFFYKKLLKAKTIDKDSV